MPLYVVQVTVTIETREDPSKLSKDAPPPQLIDKADRHLLAYGHSLVAAQEEILDRLSRHMKHERDQLINDTGNLS